MDLNLLTAIVSLPLEDDDPSILEQGAMTPRGETEPRDLRSFLTSAEEGATALETVMLVYFAALPGFWVLFRLMDIVQELQGFDSVILTSPFF